MKRILSIFLTVLILVSMTACADNKTKEISEPDIIEHDAVLSSIPESSTPPIYISAIESSEESSDRASSAEISSSQHESSSEPQSGSSSQSSAKPQSSQSGQKPSSSQQQKPSSQISDSQSTPQTPNSVPAAGETRAVWISYLEYQSMLAGKSKKSFTSSIRTMFANLAEDGFNTVFVHARSHSDAYYDSAIFPWSVYCTWTEGENPGFDPLAIMVKEAHAAGLKIEAWINPYRVSQDDDYTKLSPDNLL